VVASDLHGARLPSCVLSEVPRLLCLFPPVGPGGLPQFDRVQGASLNAVGIVCALATEARHLGPAKRHPLLPFGCRADGTLLAVSGMGAAAAEISARALVDAGATALASWGMAGGLDPALAPGAIFLPTEVIGRDGIGVETAREWRERLSREVAAFHPLSNGRLLTSSRAIGSLEEKAVLFRETGAAAVDMESLSVAQVANAHRLPFIAVRVIVDSAEDSLPAAVTVAADNAGHLRLWRLIGALARTPADLGALLRLARRYRAANRSLAAVGRVGPLTPAAAAVSDRARP
jgi:adenosylhomocysteine nucleosidase